MESSQVMNHQEAENTKATERYLLREMTDDERTAFEEHYLDCPECLEAVTFGTDFLDAGREVAAESPAQRTAVTGWRDRLMAAFRSIWQPLPAMAVAAALCLAVLGIYQQTRIAKQKNMIADLK